MSALCAVDVLKQKEDKLPLLCALHVVSCVLYSVVWERNHETWLPQTFCLSKLEVTLLTTSLQLFALGGIILGRVYRSVSREISSTGCQNIFLWILVSWLQKQMRFPWFIAVHGYQVLLLWTDCTLYSIRSGRSRVIISNFLNRPTVI